MARPLLSIEDLVVQFPTGAGVVEAVSGVSYDVRRGETVAVVGESGCGKSVTALALLGLVPPPGRIEGKAWLIFAPGLAIFFVVTVFNLVGEGLRDALDPKQRSR